MDELEIKNSETQAIVDLASKIQPVEIASRYNTRRVALPPGWKLEDRNDEGLMSIPARKKGSVSMHDDNSFIEYINRHKETEYTTIYCDSDYRESRVDFTCIFNDHGRHIDDSDTQNWKTSPPNTNHNFLKNGIVGQVKIRSCFLNWKWRSSLKRT